MRVTFSQVIQPIARRFRAKRTREFLKRMRVLETTRVLDVGGTPFNWQLADRRPNLVMLNLSLPRDWRSFDGPWVMADGRYLPFKDGTFDIVYCHSVIEHVRTWENQKLIAAECRRVGHGYYVQTPNKWFPIDPHFIAPFIHWLHRSWQRRFIRYFTLWGLLVRPTPDHCDRYLAELRLLDEGELRTLFPDAEIWHERILGLTKSLAAVRSTSTVVGDVT